MYDIACTLVKHLEVTTSIAAGYHVYAHSLLYLYDIVCFISCPTYHLQGTGSTEILERVHFAIPSFHAYGHKADCQVLTFIVSLCNIPVSLSCMHTLYRFFIVHLDVLDLGDLMERSWNAYGHTLGGSLAQLKKCVPPTELMFCAMLLFTMAPKQNKS